MDIKDLPGPGIKFRAKTGAGNFQRKLKLATRYGKYKNLQDNIPEIVKVAKQYERVIKIKGGLNRLQKRDAWLKIKKSTPRPTYADKYEIKEIINHLGRGAATKEKAVPEGYKEIKTADGKNHIVEKGVKLVKKSDGTGFLDKDRIQKNIYRNRFDRIGQNEAEEGGDVSTQKYAGGTVVETFKSYGVRGRDSNKDTISANKNVQTGFAGNYKNAKLPDNPATKAPPLGGTRPIDL